MASGRMRKLSLRSLVLAAGVAGLAGAGFADGHGAAAMFYNPTGIAVATDGAVYVADRENHSIRKLAGRTVSTVVRRCAPCSRCA